MSTPSSCPVCLDALNEKDAAGKIIPVLTTSCGHEFHLPCVMATVARNPTAPACPLCRSVWHDFVTALPVPVVPSPPAVVPSPSPMRPARPFPSTAKHLPPNDPIVPYVPSAIPGIARNLDIEVVGRSDPTTVAHSSTVDVTALLSVKSITVTGPPAETVTPGGPFSGVIASAGGAEASARPPMDILLLLDVSGSMQGAKISLVRETVMLVLQMLQPSDRVSLITFNSSASVLTGLRRCGGDDLLASRAAASSLSANGGTSIASALQAAVAVLNSRGGVGNPVTGVLLLSDGISSDLPASKVAVGELLSLGATVHSFGFGADHDAAMMSGIAEAGGGSFVFIEKFDTVRESFAACIGALTDVMAQSLVLEVTPESGAAITAVHTSFKTDSAASGGHRITLGELCDGERRDIVLTLRLPALADPTADPTRYLRALVSFNFPHEPSVVNTRSCVVCVIRPRVDEMPPAAAVRDVEVDVHRNRLTAVDAMSRAVSAASAGRYSEVTAVLQAASEVILASPSAGMDVCAALVEDLSACKTRLGSAAAARDGGTSYVMQAESGHRKQRAHYTPGSSNAAMWASKTSMAACDSLYSKRAEAMPDAYCSPASAAMPASMQRMAAKKKAGVDLTTSSAVDVSMAVPPPPSSLSFSYAAPAGPIAPFVPSPAMVGTLLPPPGASPVREEAPMRKAKAASKKKTVTTVA